jgi:hypothetical protein
MGWNCNQGFWMNVTAAQAAAIVLMAESFFGKPGGAREDGMESRIFCGSYKTAEENRIAEITGGRDINKGTKDLDRIVMTPDGARVMHNALNSSLEDIPVQKLAGIIFPYAYDAPLSFVFVHDMLSSSADRQWRLVTAVPFIENRGEAELTPNEQEHSDYFWSMHMLGVLGTSYWPKEQMIQPSVVVVGVWDGCRIWSEYSMDQLTAFIYLAKHQLHLVCDSDPDVDTLVKDDFRDYLDITMVKYNSQHDWEVDSKLEQCFNSEPERVAFWRKAFEVDESEPMQHPAVC